MTSNTPSVVMWGTIWTLRFYGWRKQRWSTSCSLQQQCRAQTLLWAGCGCCWAGLGELRQRWTHNEMHMEETPQYWKQLLLPVPKSQFKWCILLYNKHFLYNYLNIFSMSAVTWNIGFAFRLHRKSRHFNKKVMIWMQRSAKLKKKS